MATFTGDSVGGDEALIRAFNKTLDAFQVNLATAISKTIDSITSRIEALSSTRINTATTTVVLSGPGMLGSITVCATAAGIITIYDNTAGSGTVIAVLKASIAENTYTFNRAVTTGITVVTASTSDIVVTYRDNN